MKFYNLFVVAGTIAFSGFLFWSHFSTAESAEETSCRALGERLRAIDVKDKTSALHFLNALDGKLAHTPSYYDTLNEISAKKESTAKDYEKWMQQSCNNVATIHKGLMKLIDESDKIGFFGPEKKKIGERMLDYARLEISKPNNLLTVLVSINLIQKLDKKGFISLGDKKRKELSRINREADAITRMLSAKANDKNTPEENAIVLKQELSGTNKIREQLQELI